VRDLKAIYLTALARCAPERLVREVLTPDMPRNVVAIGKCAGALLDGVAHHARDAFAAIPHGYPAPRTRAIVARGGHPQCTDDSFAAGEQLQRFVAEHDDILYLISGGGSACVEVALPPFTNRQLATVNRQLLQSGVAIHEMNIVRKHLSAIKGGRLIRKGVTLIYSDVGKGALADVASGPTVADRSTKDDAIAILQRIGGCDDIVKTLERPDVPDTVRDTVGEAKLIADNETLTITAILIAVDGGAAVERWEGQIETDVEDAAQQLAARARTLRKGQMLVAGGEPTVHITGNGKGGRCSELAVRFARAMGETPDVEALFASSDGVDGNSGAAGIHLPRIAQLPPGAQAALERSDSMSVAAQIGEPIMIAPSGNNLRDLYLLARR
jgi:hydroxypyruvate reductase